VGSSLRVAGGEQPDGDGEHAPDRLPAQLAGGKALAAGRSVYRPEPGCRRWEELLTMKAVAATVKEENRLIREQNKAELKVAKATVRQASQTADC